MSKIIKTAFTLIVLHPEDVDVTSMNLQDIEYQISEGECIGQLQHLGSSTIGHPEVLKAELLAIGNDGTFFDSPFEDDE